MKAVCEAIQQVQMNLYARKLGPAADAWLQHAMCIGTMLDDDLAAFSECGYMLVSTASDKPGLMLSICLERADVMQALGLCQEDQNLHADSILRLLGCQLRLSRQVLTASQAIPCQADGLPTNCPLLQPCFADSCLAGEG